MTAKDKGSWRFYIPLDDLDLSERAKNCMINADLRLVGELISRSERELLLVKNLGRVTLSEIKQQLKILGLTLSYHFHPRSRGRIWRNLQCRRERLYA